MGVIKSYKHKRTCLTMRLVNEFEIFTPITTIIIDFLALIGFAVKENRLQFYYCSGSSCTTVKDNCDGPTLLYTRSLYKNKTDHVMVTQTACLNILMDVFF